MIEPEVAFADVFDNMSLAEDMVKHMVTHLLENCAEDIELFARFVDKQLMDTLKLVTDSEYERLTYTDAIDILEKSGQKFEFPVFWGMDLQTEHERHLCEDHFNKPVFVYNYPKTIKPFYMRMNDDGKTVAAMDLLVPQGGRTGGRQPARRAPGRAESPHGRMRHGGRLPIGGIWISGATAAHRIPVSDWALNAF